MTKAHTKVTRQKGATPWGLLRAALDGNDPEYPQERASALFRLYAAAFAGRRQLYWSNGLRALLALSAERSDEELVAAPEDERASVLATLTPEQWRAIRRKGQQAHILTVAESAPLLLTAVIEGIERSGSAGWTGGRDARDERTAPRTADVPQLPRSACPLLGSERRTHAAPPLPAVFIQILK